MNGPNTDAHAIIKDLIMQRIFENKRTRYIWKLSNMNLTYCEIPKTGSSTTKTVLFRSNYQLSSESELKVGGGQLVKEFPDSFLDKYEPSDFLDRTLIVYRNPVERVKSAYRGIFLRRQGLEGSLSEYFEKHLKFFLASEPTDGLLNHHKPMTWFFPQFLVNDARSLFVETSELNSLPDHLGLDMSCIPTKNGAAMPHLLNVDKRLGEVDMTDNEIKIALGQAFDEDFLLFEGLNNRTNDH